MASVWSTTDKTGFIALTHGNHTGTTVSGASNEGVRATTYHGASGKYYLEYTGVSHTNTSRWAFADAGYTLGNNTGIMGVDTAGDVNGGTPSPMTGTLGDPAGHTVCFAMDFDNKRMWCRYDGGLWNGIVASNPATNTGGIDISTGFTLPVVPYFYGLFNPDTGTLNCGDSAFVQTMPTGFTAWDASAAGVTPPDVVHTAGANITGASSGTVAYQTIGTDNIVLLHSQSSPNHTTGSVNITTVTDTNGLTWTKKTSLHILTPAYSGTTDNTQEIWWAHAATAVSGTITVTFGATIDDGAFTTLSISGVYDVASPFDPNVSMPATASNTSGAATAPSTTISTTAAGTLVLGFYGAPINHTETSGSLTVIVSQTNSGGTNYGYNYVGEAAYTSPQSSITASLGASVADWGFIVLALNGSTSVFSPSGTMAVTEAPDVFAAIGYSNFPGVWGSLTVLEARDVFAAVGHIPTIGAMAADGPPDTFSAYGYLPVKGTMTITEHPDVFAALGFAAGGVNGIWATTEAPDHFAAIGSTPIVGSMNVTEAPDRFQALSAGVTQVRRRRLFFVT